MTNKREGEPKGVGFEEASLGWLGLDHTIVTTMEKRVNMPELG
jgi:hypothetical protein